MRRINAGSLPFFSLGLLQQAGCRLFRSFQQFQGFLPRLGFFLEFSLDVRVTALAKYFITNLVVRVFSIVAIFHCSSESSGKLSDYLPVCLCELFKAVSGIHRVDLWNKVFVQRVHRFLIVLYISCVWEDGENILNVRSR